MKFGKIMQLWITGLMLSVSISAYAADCIQAIIDTPLLQLFTVDAEGNYVGKVPNTPGERDFLTISPSGNAPGMYEIRIIGSRDADKADVRSVQTSITHYDIPCTEEQSADAVCQCMKDSLTVEVQIRKGTNPGRSTYEKKFKVFVGEGLYSLVFKLLEDGKEFFGRVVTGDSCEPQLSLYVAPKTPVNLSLQNATAEISGTDSFTLRNLAAETTDSQGVNQKFNTWGKFQWNPNLLSWELKDAGTEK